LTGTGAILQGVLLIIIWVGMPKGKNQIALADMYEMQIMNNYQVAVAACLPMQKINFENKIDILQFISLFLYLFLAL
jgi:hypothetical protein